MVKIKINNELTDLDELLDKVIEGETKEVIEEEVKEREGEEVAKHIINTIEWLLDGWMEGRYWIYVRIYGKYTYDLSLPKLIHYLSKGNDPRHKKIMEELSSCWVIG